MQKLDDYSLFLFDLDGTVYHGDTPIPSAINYINKLITLRKEVVMLTNNSTVTEDMVKHKLANFGIDVAHIHVVGSALVAAWLLHEKQITKAYLIGEKSLIDVCAAYGIHHADEVVEAVVVGLHRSGTIRELEHACKLVQQQGVPLYATNYDFRLAHNGYYLPGAGNFVRTIEMASNQQAEVIGKPNIYMKQYLQAKFSHIPLEEWIMIGDNYDTDILFGMNNNIDTCFVNTGVTSRELIETTLKEATFMLEEL